MFKIKFFGVFFLSVCMLFILGGCEIKPPQQGERLSEVEQLYNQGNFKDAMSVARYNLKKNPKDPASVVTVWKVQLLQGTKSEEYARQFFNVARQRVSDFGNALIPYLARGMLTDASNPVRLFCLLCLGDLPEPASSEAIAKVLEPDYTLGDKPSDVNLDCLRSEAALLLAVRRYSPAFEGIVALTKSEDGETRGNAAMALGYLGDQRALPILEELKKDKEVAARADSAIAFIKGE